MFGIHERCMDFKSVIYGYSTPDTHGLMHPTWDYHSSQEGEEGFCTNCELIEILKHGRKKFKCLGHEITDLEVIFIQF